MECSTREGPTFCLEQAEGEGLPGLCDCPSWASPGPLLAKPEDSHSRMELCLLRSSSPPRAGSRSFCFRGGHVQLNNLGSSPRSPGFGLSRCTPQPNLTGPQLLIPKMGIIRHSTFLLGLMWGNKCLFLCLLLNNSTPLGKALKSQVSLLHWLPEHPRVFASEANSKSSSWASPGSELLWAFPHKETSRKLWRLSLL